MDNFFDLQIFAENTGVETGAAAGLPSGDAPAAAGEAPAAGEHDAAAREEAFETLIRGEYKDLYTRRVSEAVRGRLRKAEETEARSREAMPVLEALAARYGMEASDAAGLLEAVRREGQEREEKAVRAGKRAGEQALGWKKDAEALQKCYPGFDLRREMGNPAFRAMLKSGIPMKAAFESAHLEELMRGAVRESARTARAGAVADLLSASRRPSENGIAPRAAATHPTDVSKLSRTQRESLIRRASKGEKIRF